LNGEIVPLSPRLIFFTLLRKSGNKENKRKTYKKKRKEKTVWVDRYVRPGDRPGFLGLYAAYKRLRGL